MWLGSHVVAGGLIYDSIRKEPHRLRWPLFIVAAYIFHWLMDSTPVFHDMDWPWQWWQWGIAAWNGIVVLLFLWQGDPVLPMSRWFSKRLLLRLLVGGLGWLSLDGFWLYRPWGQAIHGLFPNMGRWAEPQSSALELAFMFVVAVLSWHRVARFARSAKLKGKRAPP